MKQNPHDYGELAIRDKTRNPTASPAQPVAWGQE